MIFSPKQNEFVCIVDCRGIGSESFAAFLNERYHKNAAVITAAVIAAQIT